MRVWFSINSVRLKGETTVQDGSSLRAASGYILGLSRVNNQQSLYALQDVSDIYNNLKRALLHNQASPVNMLQGSIRPELVTLPALDGALSFNLPFEPSFLQYLAPNNLLALNAPRERHQSDSYVSTLSRSNAPTKLERSFSRKNQGYSRDQISKSSTEPSALNSRENAAGRNDEWLDDLNLQGSTANSYHGRSFDGCPEFLDIDLTDGSFQSVGLSPAGRGRPSEKTIQLEPFERRDELMAEVAQIFGNDEVGFFDNLARDVQESGKGANPLKPFIGEFAHSDSSNRTPMKERNGLADQFAIPQEDESKSAATLHSQSSFIPPTSDSVEKNDKTPSRTLTPATMILPSIMSSSPVRVEEAVAVEPLTPPSRKRPTRPAFLYIDKRTQIPLPEIKQQSIDYKRQFANSIAQKLSKRKLRHSYEQSMKFWHHFSNDCLNVLLDFDKYSPLKVFSESSQENAQLSTLAASRLRSLSPVPPLFKYEGSDSFLSPTRGTRELELLEPSFQSHFQSSRPSTLLDSGSLAPHKASSFAEEEFLLRGPPPQPSQTAFEAADKDGESAYMPPWSKMSASSGGSSSKHSSRNSASGLSYGNLSMDAPWRFESLASENDASASFIGNKSQVSDISLPFEEVSIGAEHTHSSPRPHSWKKGAIGSSPATKGHTKFTSSDESDFFAYLVAIMQAANSNFVYFKDLVPPLSTTRTIAAAAFSHILSLASASLVSVSQPATFGDIRIDIDLKG